MADYSLTTAVSRTRRIPKTNFRMKTLSNSKKTSASRTAARVGSDARVRRSGEIIIACTHMAVVERANDSTVSVIFNPTEATRKRLAEWGDAGDERTIRVKDRAGVHISDRPHLPLGQIHDYGTTQLETQRA